MTRKFHPVTGDYSDPKDPIGCHDDSVMGIVPPFAHTLDETGAVHIAAPGQWTNSAQRDYDIIVAGGRELLTCEWALRHLREHGIDPARVHELSSGRRRKIANTLVRAARQHAHQYFSFPAGTANSPDVARLRSERIDLHVWLRGWAEGPLTLEHPQGSSYHHLLDYNDRACAKIGLPTTARSIFEKEGEPQIFVVERDWARAFAGYDLSEGESPLPFPFCCFEFRISGVRVLAFLAEQDGDHYQFCVYGRGGVWVVDDYGYHVGDGTVLRRSTETGNLDRKEFPRVAKLVRDNVRVACIMVDAEVATREIRRVSSSLVKKRVNEKRPPPRDHYVIDLKRAHGAPSSGRSVSTGAPRAPQRGHFRRGTWVHYDDVGSGEHPWVDAGGFWHSRTWRRWHFAGDPKNLVTREYRL